MLISSFIGIGQANAIERRKLQAITGFPDRIIRKAIAHEVNQGVPIVNKQDGLGYYISDDADEIERIARQEMSRGLNSVKHGRALFLAARKIRRSINQCQI